MTKRTTTLAAALALSIFSARPLAAQTSNPAAPSAPAAPSGPGALQIVVTAVQGGAQYRGEGQTKWQPLTAGARLPEGVEFRTGPKGTVQFTVGTDQVYRIDRLTIARILLASLRPDGSIKTDVGMQYGRVSKDVDAPERPHDDTIVSPSSTLAVRGTRVSLYDQPPYVPEAVSLTGRAVFDTLGRQRVAFGAKGEGTAAVTAANPDPAGNALASRLIDPSIANARTPAEQRLLADLITNGAVVTYSNTLMLPVVRGGPVPGDAQLPSLVTGNLVFIVRWDTDTHVQMQMLATGGTGEFIAPVLGLNRTPTGGHILFDHLGGPNGGFEIITYPTRSFPDGFYALTANNLGPLPTTLKFDAFITDPKGATVRQLFNAVPSDPTAGGIPEVVQTAPVGPTGGAIAYVTKDDPNFIYNINTNPFGNFGGLTAPAPAASPTAPAAGLTHAERRVRPKVQTASRNFLPPTKRAW